MKEALRAKDSRKLAAIRLIVAGIRQKEVDERKEISDLEVVSVLERMLKQRKEAIAQFEKAKRSDLADAEKFEAAVIEGYLPPRLSENEIALEVERAIAELGGEVKDVGRIMAELKNRLSGRADMSLVSQLVRARLKR
jgi:uncharacterized protein YqeY